MREVANGREGEPRERARGTVAVPPAAVEQTRKLLAAAAGATALARRLGLGRELVLRVAAGQPVRAGSVLQVLAALEREGGAS